MAEYSIGELAKRFNVSIDTLRLYDNIGIVCPERKANGYRCYSRNKMIALGYAIFLRKAELSIEQTRILLNETEIEGSHKMMAEHELFLEEKIKHLQNMQKLVHEYSESFQYALGNHGKVKEIQNKIIILSCEKNDKLQTPPNFSLLNEEYKFDFTFIGNKEMFFCDRIENPRQVVENFHYGISAVIEKDVKYNIKDFSEDFFTIIPPRRYVFSVIRCFIPEDYSEFNNVLDYIHAKNLKIIDDVIFRSVSLRNGPLKNIDYYEVFVPVM